jgi:hypothetical protein
MARFTACRPGIDVRCPRMQLARSGPLTSIGVARLLVPPSKQTASLAHVDPRKKSVRGHLLPQAVASTHKCGGGKRRAAVLGVARVAQTATHIRYVYPARGATLEYAIAGECRLSYALRKKDRVGRTPEMVGEWGRKIVRQPLTGVRQRLTLLRDPVVQRQGPGAFLRHRRRAPAQRAEHETDCQYLARARRRVAA